MHAVITDSRGFSSQSNSTRPLHVSSESTASINKGSTLLHFIALVGQVGPLSLLCVLLL